MIFDILGLIFLMALVSLTSVLLAREFSRNQEAHLRSQLDALDAAQRLREAAFQTSRALHQLAEKSRQGTQP